MTDNNNIRNSELDEVLETMNKELFDSKKKTEDEFLFLGVNIGENEEVYNKALEYALNSEQVRNFAISGQYGAGKSSILESYKNKYKNKNITFMHLSLTNFDIYNDNTTITEEKPKEKSSSIESVLEWKLISQLVYQADSANIYLSEFKHKENLIKEDVYKKSGLIVLLIASLYLFFLYFTLKNNLSFIEWPFIRLFFRILVNDFTLLLSVAYISAALFIAITKIYEKQIFKKIVKKLNIHGYEIEFNSNSNNSYLDKHFDEAIYLFRYIDVNVIVFEDIDRFKEYKVFERLREINHIVNKRRDEPIKFLYLVSDSIFTTTDRTKFFDFIIPVIPIADCSNSYGYVQSFLNSIGMSDSEFDIGFLRNVCLYIKDMRLLKNICNEYKIYSNRLIGDNLSKENLFTIVCYKNIYPEDFEKFQQHSGLLFEYQKFIQEKFDDNVIGDDKVKFNLSEKFDKVVKSSQNKSPFETFREDKSELFKTSFNLDYGFFDFVISYGYIDDSFEHYISIFPKNALSKIDQKFVTSVNEKKFLPPDYKIECPQLVSTYLTDKHLCKDEVLNYDIFKYLLKVYDENKCKKFIRCAKSNYKVDFVIGFIKYLDGDIKYIDNLFNILKLEWDEFLSSAIVENEMSDDPESSIAIISQALRTKHLENFLKSDEDNVISDFVSNNSSILSFPYKEEINAIEALNLLDVSFETLDYKNANKHLVTHIYNNDMYAINEHNIKEFLASNYKTKEAKKINNSLMTAVWSDKEQPLYNYCLKNIVIFIEELLKCQDTFEESQECIVELLDNSTITLENKTTIIKKISGKIDYITEVKTKTDIWPILLDNKKILYSEYNILSYFFFADSKITNKLAMFINSDLEHKLNFLELKNENKELLTDFSTSTFTNNELANEKYKEILTTCSFVFPSSDSTISKDKMEILIDSKLLIMNATNLKNIRDNYSEYTEVFIKNDFNKYVEIMTTAIAVKDEILKILNWECTQNITGDNKCKLIDSVGKISIKDTIYAETIKSYILNNSYDSNDNDWIFKEYTTFSQTLKNDIFRIANNDINSLVNETYPASVLLIKDLIKSGTSSATDSQKILLFYLAMKNCSRSELRSLLRYLPILEKDKYTQLLGNDDYIEFQKITQNKDILSKLEENNFITSYDDLGTAYRANKRNISES